MGAPPPSIASVLEPGPVRAVAMAAAAGSLQMDLAVCGDRARAIASRAVDRALEAAQEHAHGHR